MFVFISRTLGRMEVIGNLAGIVIQSYGFEPRCVHQRLTPFVRDQRNPRTTRGFRFGHLELFVRMVPKRKKTRPQVETWGRKESGDALPLVKT